MAEDSLPAGSDVAGYRIERLVGTGHMGAVYLARSPELQRSEALKVLKRDLLEDETFRTRFLREADVAAQLNHPSIVPVYRRGSTDDGLLWIAMLFVDGTDADTAVRQGGLSMRQVLHIGTEIASALDYAHNHGVVHRDVKPANFLLSKPIAPSTIERVFLGDFGLAHSIGQSQMGRSGGAVLATVGYAAPEVLAGGEVDERSDLYSLGCSLVRMVTGRRPFEGSIDEVIEGHLRRSVPRVSEMRDGLPPAMDAVIAKAMAKDPTRRFESATALMSAVAEALHAPSEPRQRPTGTQTAPRAAASPVRELSSPEGGAEPARGNLGDFAPPPARSRAGAGAGLRTRAAAAGLSGLLRDSSPKRVGVAAAAAAAVIGCVIWWAGSSPGEDSNTPADLSSVSSESSPHSTIRVTNSPVPVRDSGADQRLLASLPPGFPPGACQAIAPTGGAMASALCRPTGDPAVLAGVTYDQMPNRTAMLSKLIGQIDALTVQVCPGNIKSPGNWHRNAAPDHTAGIVVCGMEQGTPVVVWTTDSQALVTEIKADDGTTLDQLYGWWSFHS